MFDIWRVGYVRRPLAQLAFAPIAASEIRWLPPRESFQYDADPFPIIREGVLTIFVEAFDYRVRRGEIHFYQYDAGDRLIRQGVALAEPFHLSYPALIEEESELYMVPEGYKSGGLNLYRCVRFPDRWERVARIADFPAIDATLIRHAGRWWMFHALPGPHDQAMRELHVAYADTLTGPWTPHPGGAVMTGRTLSRPGGTAFVHDGVPHLPVQDCTDTYGQAITLLRIDVLTPDRFRARPVHRLEPAGLLPGFEDGLHTLSGGPEVTCIDVKGIRRSRAEGTIRTQYKLRRLFGLNGPQVRS
ncbi:hypothetical protein BH10PSE2_BH10PSE2_28590 [soil metagenome]